MRRSATCRLILIGSTLFAVAPGCSDPTEVSEVRRALTKTAQNFHRLPTAS
jgi:hypothetical protein